ncbi:uncharacterized protein [Ptychodera flava]|uniref:uncharacterized protein n=1 Tax=Ptychodera flava TaxID=63121 RepID=UPI00396A336F
MPSPCGTFLPDFGVVLLVLSMIYPIAHSWHDLGNTQYHCWSLVNPSEDNMVDCPGFSMEWLSVPDEVISEGGFNVTYRIAASDAFFDWAVRNDTEYAQVYGNLGGSICGPWVPPDGDIFTHTASLVSPLDDKLDWVTEVRLIPAGTTSIIAHIRIGNLQAALHHVVQVLPKTVCGNDKCESDRGEDCEVCPKDCGSCPLKPAEIAGIAMACILVIFVFIAVILYFYIKQQKMLWDESWIIVYDDIQPDTGIRGFMGSVISVQKSVDKMTETGSSGAGMAMAAQQKQIFTQTGIYKGQTIAIKKVQKMAFSLTKSIRKEVKQVRDLSHPNLCKFIGGCIEMPDIYICTEYCPKGSLNDVLLNDDIPLNWGFS